MDGLGKQRCLDQKCPAVTGYEYLKNKLGIVPEALVCLEHTIKIQPDKLVENIPILIKRLIDLDRLPEDMRVKPEIVSGLLTILTGNNDSLEKLAEAMKVDPGLIEVCMKISSITSHGESEIPKYLLEFLQSPLLSRVWNKLKINPEIIDCLLSLSFRTFNIDNPNRLLQKLNLVENIDISFSQFLLAITDSYIELQSVKMPELSQYSERRLATIERLNKYLTPVAKKFFLDPDLALIAMRIRQGDFFIIEDYANYLHPLLPTSKARRLAMGMCGVMTLPISFKRQFYKYPDKFEYNLTFESAVEMLCDLLKINPIVARIMMLDDEALNLCAGKFEINKTVLCWYIVTLINLPFFALETIAMRELRKSIYLKELELKEILKVLEEKEEEERKKNSPSPPYAATTDPKSPQSQPAQPVDLNAQPPPVKVEIKEENNVKPEVETRKLLKILMESVDFKKRIAASQNYYEKINFDEDKEYKNIKENNVNTMSHLNELFEVILFNKETYTHVNYDYITAKERREGIFNFHKVKSRRVQYKRRACD